MISVLGISKEYKLNKHTTIKALNNVNFTVKEGSIVGLIGYNGAGKSTLIKLLIGILKPTQGEIIYKDNLNKSKKQFLNFIGVMFAQKSALFYDVPVKYSIDFYSKLYKGTSKNYLEYLDSFIEKLKIKEYLSTPVRKLSFGQRMKVELLVAVINNPRILFLDEPTIGIDAISKEEILSFLKDINKKFNTTIIYTSHDLNTIEKLCDQIVILDKGQLIYDGKSENFKNRKEYKIIDITYINKVSWLMNSHIIDQSETDIKILIRKEEVDIIIKRLIGDDNIVDFNVTTPDLEYVFASKGNLQ